MNEQPAATADLTTLLKNLQGAPAETQKLMYDLVDKTASKVMQIARSKAPVRTGALRESINVKKPKPNIAVIGPDVEYGVYQEFGTASMGEFGGKPYEILPKKGKYLVFTIDGKKIFAKKVVHPGVKAKYYMRGALETVLKPFVDELAEIGAVSIVKGKNAKMSLGLAVSQTKTLLILFHTVW